MEEKNASNQASNLEKLISEVQQVEVEEYSEENLRVGNDREIKMDVLTLPPRSEVHQQSKRAHLRISKPLKRFIWVVVCIISLISGSIYFFGNELMEILM